MFRGILCNLKGDFDLKKLNLEKYGITGTTEIIHNPSYELLFFGRNKRKS